VGRKHFGNCNDRNNPITRRKLRGVVANTPRCESTLGYLPSGVETDATPEGQVNMAAQTKFDCWRLVGLDRIPFAIGQNW
jgi:hypothetical protein